MTTPQLLLYALLPLAAYLLGSIPFAFVIGKAHGVDIRTTGSKNIGATNLGRTLGQKYFWQAFFLDALKGFLPALTASLLLAHFNNEIANQNAASFDVLAQTLPVTTSFVIRHSSFVISSLPSWAPLLSAAAAVLGHLFPLYLKFKGGKGVATGFGAVLGIWPLFTLAGLFGGLIFVFTLLVHRYISLASIIGAFVFALAATTLALKDIFPIHTQLAPNDLLPILITAWLFFLMILLRHRANIARLLKGTEPQIGQHTVDKAKLK